MKGVSWSDDLFELIKEDLTEIDREKLLSISICLWEKKVDNGLKIVIHRIVLKRKEYLLTKGDNNNFIDKIKVKNDLVLGVALL